MNFDEIFIKALEMNDIEKIKNIPKTDFHNHSALGCNRLSLKKIGIIIPDFEKINSIEQMNVFSKKYISELTKSEEGFKFLIENSILSAISDGITSLETSIDFRFFRFFENVNYGLDFLKRLKKLYSDKLLINYDIGLSRKNYNKDFKNLILDLIDSGIFKGIDLYGDENYNDLSKFRELYFYAKRCGLKLKAHVGEFGNASNIIETVKYLDLDIIQHGINIVTSKEAIEFARKRNIVFNVCVSSNLLLGRVNNIKEHPIKIMYDLGLNITINTDDLTLFDSTVSNEYLELYKNKIFTAEELNEIRKKSFKY